MIQIGARAHDYGKDTPDHLFQKISADGFASIQLAFKKAILGVETFRDITPSVLEEVIETKQKFHLHLAVLGVYIEPALVENEAQRKDGVAEFISSIPIAQKLGADCIGTETTRMSMQPKVTRKEALDVLYRSLWKIIPEAELYGVTVAIEPVYYHTVNTPECAAEVLKTMACQNLKIIFDPVNLLSAEELPVQNQLWERAFERFGEKIAAVHMKGAVVDEQKNMISSNFEQSLINYEFIFSCLKTLPQNFSVLREEANPLTGADDCEFLKSLIV
jgi:L-ribulose-5-phosphate 3-epimerase